MNIKEEIYNFISMKESSGALLLSGKWGCGKTFLMYDISTELNEREKYAVVCVSLFGVDSISSLNRKVKECIFNIMVNPTPANPDTRKASKIRNTVSTMALALSDYSSIAKGINAALSVNLYDLIEIKQYIKCKQRGEYAKKELVLVFDDFERSQLNIVELLGAINDYAENRHIKTIIVADEEKVSQRTSDRDGEYSIYKEKLIARTLKLAPEYDEIIESIAHHYNENVPGYNAFLQSNHKKISQLFCESKSENIRILKSILIDFERVYSVWIKTDVSNEHISDTLYSFGAISFEFKSGNYKKGKYGYLHADSELKKKYEQFNRYGSDFPALRVWITEGIWNEENFCSEIRRRFCPELLTDERKFILYGFWDLQQENIDKGLPVAVEKAYKGELCRDDLISLLQKIHALNVREIELPCTVDYKKIEEGLKHRKNSIKAGLITEPDKRIFTEDGQLDAEAVQLNRQIEAMDEFLHALANRNKYMMYLHQNDNVNRYDIKGIVLSSFDDELLALFIQKYTSSDNSSKRELALSLIGLSFSDSTYSSADEIATSIRNFRLLIHRVDQICQDEQDKIAIVISKSFLEKINETIDALLEKSAPIDESDKGQVDNGLDT